MGKEIFENMEFLMSELHKEWDRSGEVKAVLTLPLKDLDKIKKDITHCIYLRQQNVENEDILFSKCVELSHDNYVLLRLVRKIKEVDETLKDEDRKSEFTLSLDVEEFKVYKELFEKKVE